VSNDHGWLAFVRRRSSVDICFKHLLAASYLLINRDPNAPNATGAASTGDGDALTTGGLQRMYGVGAQYMFGKSSVDLVWTHTSTESAFPATRFEPRCGL